MVKQPQFWLISGRLSHQQILTVTNQRHKLKQKNCEHLKPSFYVPHVKILLPCKFVSFLKTAGRAVFSRLLSY